MGGGGGGYSGQQQVAYVEQKPASKGSGMGMLALAGSWVFLGLTVQFIQSFPLL